MNFFPASLTLFWPLGLTCRLSGCSWLGDVMQGVRGGGVSPPSGLVDHIHRMQDGFLESSISTRTQDVGTCSFLSFSMSPHMDVPRYRYGLPEESGSIEVYPF